jgi:catechol 2,3-dioxygenase-like lactoylglutathione lyase family enzyme
MRILPEGVNVTQMALVVRDLDRAMAYWSRLGIGPWQVYTFGPHRVQDMVYRGQARPYGFKFAICGNAITSFELIESTAGPNIYDEHLAAHGEGLHHLGYFVDDINAAVAAMAERGFAVTQSGHGFGADGDGFYAYFDTEEQLGCVLEAVQAPRALPPPERWYPAPSAE